MSYRINLVAVSVLAFASVAYADDEPETVEVLKQQNQKIKEACDKGQCSSADVKQLEDNKSRIEDATAKFRFGVAIGYEAYKDDYINSVEIVGDTKTVHVSDSQKYKPSFWLETHYIWDGLAKKMNRTHSAPGFYVGLRAIGPDSELFDGFSLGALWSFKRTRIGDVPQPGQIAESINIGIGPLWHKTKRLAAGIVDGQPLPAPYQDAKLDDRDELSWIIMVSAGF